MRKLYRLTFMLTVLVPALLSLAAMPAAANVINSATVNLTCNSYTINVTGGNLDTANVTFSVNYTFNVVQNGGSSFTISDSIPVTPDSSLNFNASVTKMTGPLSGSFSLSGTATLVDSNGDTFNTVAITFTPNPLVCQANCPSTTTFGAANGFALLALDYGSMIINSATSINGDVGYGAYVTSTTNQKVGSFTGTAYVHSTATFVDTPATFQPSGGIVTGGAADTLLNQANTDAASAAAYFAGLTANASLGSVSANVNLTATGPVNVYDVTNWSFNSNTLTLNGASNSVFVFRVTGSFDWAQSQTVLNGVSAENVVFYFPNASSITVNKQPTVFAGTILAPSGSVIYHNPTTFTGRIIAKNIDVHSDFNISLPQCP